MTDIDERLRLPVLEQWLDDHHVDWRLDPAIPLDRIDMHAGLANQVRNDPLDQSTVERYRDDIEAGDVFPALLLRDIDGQLLPLGGNHRLAAHIAADLATVAAYTIVCDDTVADLAAYQDNRHHGKPTTLAENITHALRLHRNGLTIADAARTAGVNRLHLDLRVGAERATDRAQRLGIVSASRSIRAAGHLEWRKLGVTARYHLGRIIDPDVFIRASELVLQRVITAATVEKIAGRLNQLPADEALAQLDELAAAEEGRIRNTAGRPPSSKTHPSASLLHLLDQVMRYDPDDVAGDCPTPEQRATIRGQIRAAARKLMAVDQAIEGVGPPQLEAVR